MFRRGRGDDRVFTFTIKGDMQKRFEEIKAKATARGVKVEGDSKRGRIKGRMGSAEYETSGNELTVRVLDAPFFVPNDVIRKELEKFIEG